MMLPPNELKTKKFSKTFHGYSPDEVDEQIAFLLEQYTDLYNENDELDRKLKLAQAQVDSYKGDEASIREALLDAQQTSEKVLREANERAEILLAAAKKTCDRMVRETAVKVREEQRVLEQLRAQASAFRQTLLAQYEAQLAQVQQMAQSDRDTDLTEFADEALVRAIVDGIKDEVARKAEQSAAASKRRARGMVWNKDRAKDGTAPHAQVSEKSDADAAKAENPPKESREATEAADPVETSNELPAAGEK